MARRPPAAVRAARPRRANRHIKVPEIDGLPIAAARQISLYERSSLSPGAVARALADWKRAVHRPVARLLQDASQAGCPCCDPLEHRDVLAKALAALGPRARRELLERLRPLDEVFERHTIHDPQAPPEKPWWRRRA